MELKIQLFGGRGGSSGVATAGSLQDTYGQMAESREQQKKWNGPVVDHEEYGEIPMEVDGVLRTDMDPEDLAQSLFDEGRSKDNMRQLTNMFREYARDTQHWEARINRINNDYDRRQAVRDFDTNFGDDSYWIIHRNGEQLVLFSDMDPKERSKARSWITKGQVAYIQHSDGWGTQDSLGLSTGLSDLWRSPSTRDVTQGTPRDRIIDAVTGTSMGQERYNEQVERLFGTDWGNKHPRQ